MSISMSVCVACERGRTSSRTVSSDGFVRVRSSAGPKMNSSQTSLALAVMSHSLSLSLVTSWKTCFICCTCRRLSDSFIIYCTDRDITQINGNGIAIRTYIRMIIIMIMIQCASPAPLTKLVFPPRTFSPSKRLCMHNHKFMPSREMIHII